MRGKSRGLEDKWKIGEEGDLRDEERKNGGESREGKTREESWGRKKRTDERERRSGWGG